MMPSLDTAASGCAIAIGAIFLAAGLRKLRDLAATAAAIDLYRILPTQGSRVLALPLALLEALSGVLLLVPSQRFIGALAISAILAAYTFAIALNVVRGSTDFDCGCGDAILLQSGVALLARNGVMLVLSAGLAFAVGAPAHALDWLTAISVALLLLLLWRWTNMLIAALQEPRDD